MSSVTVDHPIKVGVGMTNKKENARKVPNVPHKKHNKHEENRHFKFNGRKRLQSFTNNGKFCPPKKRWKKDGIIPPTKFLLGGNICDPLNLNSMQDEEVNRALNAVTPKSSPLPTPKHRKEAIEVIIPPNIYDPLNLTNCNDDAEYEKQLLSPIKKNNKKKHKNRKKKKSLNNDGVDKNASVEMKDNEPQAIDGASSVAEIVVEEACTEQPLSVKSPIKEQQLVQEQQQSNADTQPQLPPQKEKIKPKLKCLDEPKDKRLRKLDSKDKIVSPVIPQPGAWKSRLQHRPNQDKKKKKVNEPMPRFDDKNTRFQYGNYNRYYGYRNPHHEVDPRLTIFGQRKELFEGKNVLDIGCNIGHITLSVARDLAAQSVTGIDIDKKLIKIARKNVKHYINCYQSQSPAVAEDGTVKEADPNVFPISMVINYGPIDIPGFTKHEYKGFPYNVTFVQGNYVLEDDALLTSEQPQFDTILCLSTTKWIQLNFGDAGLQQSFKRMYAQLKPGGVLILEPQNWSGYKKKKKLTEKIFRNYQNIEFYPPKFSSYLLTEVGFRSYETITVPVHVSKGFQRSILIFRKANVESPPVTATTLPSDEPKTLEEARERRRQNSEQRDYELMNYDRDLFPTESRDIGSMSETSQRSAESFSQYEHLANIYAPSGTPCYDHTPVHTNDNSNLPEKMCYLDVKMDHDEDTKTSEENQLQPIPEDPETTEDSQINSQPLVVTVSDANTTPKMDIDSRQTSPKDCVPIDNRQLNMEKNTIFQDDEQQRPEVKVDVQQQKIVLEESNSGQQTQNQVDNT
ncbi:7SK snRNA methylphosphate capping enzyme [Copidosoma floridanum]|uniref:7SK snRNA methylphosphate capping enzyme n=1 Tax=Copidosoma floridanum TaxID=29053 RepID=UPI0006C96964|nr:7SK snRNA methylphosphate capping enzyme [Copidosoma floridanum]